MGIKQSLEDKYTAETGHVFMSGTQALIRLPMVQMRRDRIKGLNTAAYISGYRGSPLGTYDQQLLLAQSHLQALDIKFHPGVNEDLAATAIWGTQQVPLIEDAQKQGVLGIWYGKGPGVDRCGDVFRHANAAGSSEHGGVLCLAGDDHSAKSSTVQHQSDHAFIAARMPMLYPSSVHEFVELGLLGIALSRYSGCWAGFKLISDTVETSAVVSIDKEMMDIHIPNDFELPEGGLNIRWPDAFADQDVRLHEMKEKAVFAFARANNIDQWVLKPHRKRLGIIASGKAYEDTRQALQQLEIDESVSEVIGLHLYKVRMPFPLEPTGVCAFADGLEEVLVLEERREIIEQQLKTALYYQEKRSRIVGKKDEHGNDYLPTAATLSVSICMRAIATRLLNLDIDESLKAQLQERLSELNNNTQKQLLHSTPTERKPWFCSGCPHNTSTRVPQGSKALAGIGCHFMVLWMDRDTETFTHMGAEGVPWTSVSHYVDDKHRFVNIGDGTYYHSGYLAIRAAVHSGANLTYKVLYNDAVAMTGGQSIDGGLTPTQITHQLKAEGVSPIYLVTDEPEQYSSNNVAEGVVIRHRDYLDEVMCDLRERTGCNAIVYVQTCAAEKRRRRKRGLMVDPDKRLFINSDVCEGCGDCSTQSNCVSVEPLETPLGRKRRINQSSCNKDYSCINGFCPSFVTLKGATLKRRQAQQIKTSQTLPDPVVPALNNNSWNILITGVGGTGVLTIGSVLGMAAHIDGHAAMLLDMAGLAQKGGAVQSHVRIAKSPEHVTSAHIVPQGCDLLFAADAVVASSKSAAELLDNKRTHAVVNTASTPIADFVLQRDLDFSDDSVALVIKKQVKNAEHFRGFTQVAEQLTGDAISTNILMLGYAWQQGLVPVSLHALQSAITLNGVAVKSNLRALHCGRVLAAKPDTLSALLNEPATISASKTAAEIIEHRAEHLMAYQGRKLAAKYQKTIKQLSDCIVEKGLNPELLNIAAHNYARVLSYKDEYEVSRLYALPSFQRSLQDQFDGDYTIEFNLAPPMLGGIAPNGRPKKRAMGPWVMSLFKLLQRGKVLRGTPLDVFGYTRERRQERQWVTWYEQDLQRLLTELTKDNQAVGEHLLAVPDQIRGFGPVKMQAMLACEKRRVSLWQEFEAPKPIDLTSAA